ncbi:hypothetical protein GCM10025858_06490 [Alicyclobacillus sacchari]|nr:hypothetical protein GCM10025858_06490 [Alicyclobacillus sacchari]
MCTVIGFPHGTSTQGALRFEVADAVASGAVEIDMVGPVGALVEGDLATWYEAVRAVVDTARQFAAPPVVKVILETSALPIDAVIKGAMVAVAAGVDFVKTSTGFHAGGALVADVAAMTMAVGGRAGVKASAAFAPPKRRSCCCASGQIGSARPQRGNCCRNFSPQATAFRRAPQTGA